MDLKNSKTIGGSLKKLFNVGKKTDPNLKLRNDIARNSGIVSKQVPMTSPTISVSRLKKIKRVFALI